MFDALHPPPSPAEVPTSPPSTPPAQEPHPEFVVVECEFCEMHHRVRWTPLTAYSKCPCRTCLPLIRQASDEAWEATELILKDPLRSPVDRMLAIEAVQQKIRARVLELITERRRNHPEG